MARVSSDAKGGPLRDGAPLSHRIADEIRTQIDDGTLAPGAQLPTEVDLMQLHSVSRNTVRGALRRLIDEGLVVAGQGRGTFVRESHEPIVWDWTTLESRNAHHHEVAGLDQWSAAVTATGRQPRQEITVSIVEPPPPVARRLGIKPKSGTAVVLRRRVRFVDHVPYQLADSYFPVGLVTGTPLMEPRDVSAPGGILASVGLIQARYHDEITVRMPTRGEIERLSLPAATPVAEHMRTGYDADDQPLRVMITILPGDRHVLAYDVPAE
jgi:DNA-binding GntR family transcriptional regulator